MVQVFKNRITDPHSEGTRPVIEVCKLDNVEIVRLLLRAGAKINAFSSSGVTPLARTLVGHINVVRYLFPRFSHCREILDAGAEVNEKIKDFLAIFTAIYTKNEELVNLL